MNILTIVLACFVVVAHCIAIFWPRKPMTASVDQDGLPVLWCNETTVKKDVVCVWWDEPEDDTQPKVGSSLHSFSDAIHPLAEQSALERRFVA